MNFQIQSPVSPISTLLNTANIYKLRQREIQDFKDLLKSTGSERDYYQDLSQKYKEEINELADNIFRFHIIKIIFFLFLIKNFIKSLFIIILNYYLIKNYFKLIFFIISVFLRLNRDCKSAKRITEELNLSRDNVQELQKKNSDMRSEIADLQVKNDATSFLVDRLKYDFVDYSNRIEILTKENEHLNLLVEETQNKRRDDAQIYNFTRDVCVFLILIIN